MTDRIQKARIGLFDLLTFDDHEPGCPANTARVRDKGPCDCGSEHEANVELDELIEAIRQDEREKAGAIVDAVMAVSQARAWFSQSKASLKLKHVLWEAIKAYKNEDKQDA